MKRVVAVSAIVALLTAFALMVSEQPTWAFSTNKREQGQYTIYSWCFDRYDVQKLATDFWAAQNYASQMVDRVMRDKHSFLSSIPYRSAFIITQAVYAYRIGSTAKQYRNIPDLKWLCFELKYDNSLLPFIRAASTLEQIISLIKQALSGLVLR